MNESKTTSPKKEEHVQKALREFLSAAKKDHVASGTPYVSRVKKYIGLKKFIYATWYLSKFYHDNCFTSELQETANILHTELMYIAQEMP